MKHKDDVLGIFKYFHAKVKRESGKSLKYIPTINGGEYIGEFEEYYISYGIRYKQTKQGTTQHNGLVERMNWTICDRIWYRLSYAKLARSYWGEAIRTACYLINLSPLVPLKGDYPERV